MAVIIVAMKQPADYTISAMTAADYESVATFWRQQEGIGLNESDERKPIEQFLNRNPGMSKQAVMTGEVLQPDAEIDGAPATRVRSYWQSVGYRLRHDWVTLAFGAVVLAIVIAALAAPLLAPFDPYAQSIIGRLKPFGWRGHPLGTDVVCD